MWRGSEQPGASLPEALGMARAIGESPVAGGNLSAMLPPVRLAIIVCFLNEEAHLPALFESIVAQQRLPDRLVLVDDGSSDGSLRLAQEFASANEYALVVSRPRRPPERDRLANAGVLKAFCAAAEQLDTPWDIVAKLDADIRLTPLTFAEIERRFEADPRLGIAGPHTSTLLADEYLRRERCPDGHVQGATKFYRRECFGEVFPLVMRLGWDTTDEVSARMHGWRTRSFDMPDGDAVHLRRMASRDGMLRGYRRTGTAAYIYGARWWWVLPAAVSRAREQPRVLGGLNYLIGWFTAAVRRDPRDAAPQRAFLAREHRARAIAALARRPGR